MEIGIENITDLPAAAVSFIEAIGEKKIIVLSTAKNTGLATAWVPARAAERGSRPSS